MSTAKVMYGLIDETGDLIMVPDNKSVLHVWFPDREQVEFLAGQGARLVKITVEPIDASAIDAHTPHD
jgi:hypothetical protein